MPENASFRVDAVRKVSVVVSPNVPSESGDRGDTKITKEVVALRRMAD